MHTTHASKQAAGENKSLRFFVIVVETSQYSTPAVLLSDLTQGPGSILLLIGPYEITLDFLGTLTAAKSALTASPAAEHPGKAQIRCPHPRGCCDEHCTPSNSGDATQPAQDRERGGHVDARSCSPAPTKVGVSNG